MTTVNGVAFDGRNIISLSFVGKIKGRNYNQVV